jgi:hypothetical protein
MESNSQRILRLYEELLQQKEHPFPQPGEPLEASKKQGVYVIRQGRKVVHAGRTMGGKEGLKQRLSDHLKGKSSFAMHFLGGDGSRLRTGYTFQYLEVSDAKNRAWLEALVAGTLCPAHIGIGREA